MHKLRMLQELPSALDDLFTLILDKVMRIHRRETLLLFQWVVLSTLPLTLENLNYAIAFSGEQPPTSIEAWKSSEVYIAEDEALIGLIRDRSGGLLEVVRNDADHIV